MRDSLQLIKSMFQTAEVLSKQVRESPPYDALLSLLDQALERVHFVQVGAHDGTSNDRLWPFITRKHWTGMMVEPHPDSFRSLQMLCANDFPRLTIVNKAITNRKGAVTLIEPDTPFGSQTATIEPSSGWARYRPSKRTFTVDGITLAELLAQHSVDRIDVLQIDTEGHEAGAGALPSDHSEMGMSGIAALQEAADLHASSKHLLPLATNTTPQLMFVTTREVSLPNLTSKLSVQNPPYLGPESTCA